MVWNTKIGVLKNSYYLILWNWTKNRQMFLSWLKSSRALSLSEKGQLVKHFWCREKWLQKKEVKIFSQMLFIQIKMMIVSIMLNKIVVPLLFVLPTFANCLQFKSFNIWRLFISLPFYLVSSSSLSSSTLEGRLCMCLQ